MKHRNRNRQRTTVQATTAPVQATTMDFAFGDPEPVLDRREIFDYLESPVIGKYYAPPISLPGLTKAFRAAVHHSSALLLKRNVLMSTFIPHPRLSLEQFSRMALDFMALGNAYLERKRSVLGTTIAYEAPLAKYMRVGIDPGAFWFLSAGKPDHEFATGDVFHIKETDLDQEVYGLPEYLSALQAVFLNESATLFRRRYYKNGSHAGFIFYMTDAAQKQEDVDNLKEAFKQAKGPGNFRNLFLYAPGGKKDGVQLIPVSEVAAKDDFLNIKAVTRDDQLAAHRVPPQLMGIVPNNTGGFGDVEKAAAVFATNEIKPLQARMRSVNTWAGEEIVRFNDYMLTTT
ncbi:MAG: phage portal protein [Moraxellaceae bacterium]|nr:phage portal protein [Moraxellaceae bacterium]